MSLKTAYNLQEQLLNVFNLGFSHIQSTPTPTPAYTLLSNGLAAAALSGKRTFTISIAHNAVNDDLELLGPYWDSYRSGLMTAMMNEGIYMNELNITLNNVNTGPSTLSFNFTF